MWSLLPVPPLSDPDPTEENGLHAALRAASGAVDASGEFKQHDGRDAPWLRLAYAPGAWEDTRGDRPAWRRLPVPAKSDCLPHLAEPLTPWPPLSPQPCCTCCCIDVGFLGQLHVLLQAGCEGAAESCSNAQGPTAAGAPGEHPRSRGAVHRALLASKFVRKGQRPVPQRRTRPRSPLRTREAIPWRMSVRDVQDLAMGTLELASPQWTPCASAEDAVARARELRGRLEPGPSSTGSATSRVLEALFEAWDGKCDSVISAAARPMARQVLSLYVLARGVPSVPSDHRRLIVGIARDIARDGPPPPPPPRPPAAATATVRSPRVPQRPRKSEDASPHASIVVDAPFAAWCSRRLRLRRLSGSGAPAPLEAVSPSPVYSATDSRGERVLSVVECAVLGRDQAVLAAYVKDVVAAAAAARFVLILCACLCEQGGRICPCSDVASCVAGAVAVLPASAGVMFVCGEEATAAAVEQACAALGESHGPGPTAGPRRGAGVDDPTLSSEHERFLGHLHFCSPALARVLAGAEPSLHLSQKVALAVQYAERIARGHAAGMRLHVDG